MLSNQFSIKLMEELFDIADLVKKITRKSNGVEFLKSLLCHKIAMLYFTQPSTRTFLSFLTACQMVGMDNGSEVDTDPRTMYWRQLRNGVYIRAAIILYIFNVAHRLKEY